MGNAANEVTLLKECLKGNANAFEGIVTQYQELVCAITYSGTADVQLSEELAHQTFINAWNKLSQLRDLSKFRPWLCTIARNHVNSFLRKNKRDILQKAKPMEYINDMAADESGPLESAIKKEHKELVDSAIAQVPEQYRESLILYYRQQQSVKQVAQLLDLSEETVKKHLQRSRKMIKEQLSSIVEETLSATGPKKVFATAVVASIAGLAVKSSAAAAGVAAEVSTAGTTTGAAAVMSGVTAKIVAAVAVVAIGVGSVITYRQVTQPDSEPYSLETSSTVHEGKEGRNGITGETVKKSKGRTTNPTDSDNSIRKPNETPNLKANLSDRNRLEFHQVNSYTAGEHGVDFWAGLDNLVWKSNEKPVLKADLSHRGNSELHVVDSYMLEYDGERYVVSPNNNNADWPGDYRRDADYRDIIFDLDNRWISSQSGEKLKLTPGLHRAYLAFYAKLSDSAEEKFVKIMSNTVKFKILDPGEDITEEEILQVAIGGWPGEKYTPEEVAALHFKEYGQKLTYNELATFYCDKTKKVKDADLTERALAFDQDDVDCLRLYCVLGQAYHSQLRKYSSPLWVRQRRIVARAYLAGLSYALDLDLPIDRPDSMQRQIFKCYDLKKEIPIGHLPTVARSVPRDIDRIRKLVDLRRELTSYIIDIYSRKPAQIQELHDLVMEYIGDEKAATQLADAVKERSENSRSPVPVISIEREKEFYESEFVDTFKIYDSNEFKIEAGFVPEKTEAVLGEPLSMIFYVKNIGKKPYQFFFGGDNRGSVRHNRFRITAKDENGEAVKDPHSYNNFGGFGGEINLEYGDIYSEKLNLQNWCEFEKAGLYTVKCSFPLTKEHGPFGQSNSDILVEIAYDLKILPSNKDNIQNSVEQILEQAYLSTGDQLAENINILCSFGEQAAVPGLTIMSIEGDIEHRIAAIKGLGQIVTDESLTTLLTAQADPDKSIRMAAIESLGSFKSDKAMDTAAAALRDSDEDICCIAAGTLGAMQTDAAIDVLIEYLPKARPQVAASILRAIGKTKSKRVFDVIVEYLDHQDSVCRYGAVDGLAGFNDENATGALRGRISEEKNMDLREYIVRALAEKMRQAIDSEWLVPVIKSRKGTNSIGDAPRLMRLYGGPKSVPALLSCLDHENPSIRSSYNWWVIYSQSSCNGGLITPWISDLNRDSTPEEIESNRNTLRILKSWVKHYYENRLDEEAMEKWPDWWGEPVDGISIRVRVNQFVWPEGIPQLIMFDVRSHPGEGSVNITSVPDPLEVELNGDWYAHYPPLKEATAGLELMGKSVQNIVLDENWFRVSDGQPLELKPGEYTLRVGLSTTPENQRTGLAISKPIQFEVIETN